MKKATLIKWTIVGAAFLFICLFVKWLDNTRPLKILITPEGDKLEFVDYYYGNHDVLKERKGPWWKFWETPKPIFPDARPNPGRTSQSPEPLILWFTQNSIRRVMSMRTELSPMLVEVSDDLGAHVFALVKPVGLL